MVYIDKLQVKFKNVEKNKISSWPSIRNWLVDEIFLDWKINIRDSRESLYNKYIYIWLLKMIIYIYILISIISKINIVDSSLSTKSLHAPIGQI